MATLPPVLCARRAAKRRATRISSVSSTTTRKTRLACALALPSATAPASDDPAPGDPAAGALRSEEHTSELQSLMRISYAVFCLKKKTNTKDKPYVEPAQHTT